MEACATARYWARETVKLGHEVRLIPPAYVKPFVKRQKNDAADAEAIVEFAPEGANRLEEILWLLACSLHCCPNNDCVNPRRRSLLSVTQEQGLND